MPRRNEGLPTIEKITEEARFLMRTLLRDDLFGSVVSLSEAEKLLEPSLSLGFADYCAFLKKGGYLQIDRQDNTVSVTDRGRRIAEGHDDPSFHTDIAVHFTPRLRRDEAGGAASSANGASPASAGRESAGTSAHADPASPHEVQTRPEGGQEMVGGRFLRYEAIGQGGLGTVYRGKNLLLGNPIAIKEVRHVFEFVSYLSREEIVRRLRREVMAQAQLEHPHLIAIHDVDFECTYPFLVMDFARGGSLKERMFRAKVEGAGTIPVEITLRYLLQILYALEYAHEQQVVHGNLKPENVLFDRMGNVKLTDFGMGRVTEKEAAQSAPVYIGMGTPSYMAPEQLHGNAPVGPAADVYALGILLYEMLTGTLPGRRSPMPSQVNSDVPQLLDDLFDKMTTDRIEDRYRSMGEILDLLYENYKAETILKRGSLLLFQVDPQPPVPDDDAPAEEAEPSATTDGPPEAVVVTAEMKVSKQDLEEITGEDQD